MWEFPGKTYSDVLNMVNDFMDELKQIKIGHSITADFSTGMSLQKIKYVVFEHALIIEAKLSIKTTNLVETYNFS